MTDILPLRPAPATTKSLSTLLSRSKDDFYSELQTVMNAIPADLPTRPHHAGNSASYSTLGK